MKIILEEFVNYNKSSGNLVSNERVFIIAALSCASAAAGRAAVAVPPTLAEALDQGALVQIQYRRDREHAQGETSCVVHVNANRRDRQKVVPTSLNLENSRRFGLTPGSFTRSTNCHNLHAPAPAQP